MTSVPHSGAKSVTPGGSVAGGHTKGPWEVVRVEDVLAIMPDPITGHADSFLGIAIIQEHDGERAARRVEANARLIVVVLDLLEALGEARDALHQHYVDWDGEPEDAVPLQLARAKCDAAITKATAGETRNAEPIHRRDGDAESGGVNHNALEGQA